MGENSFLPYSLSEFPLEKNPRVQMITYGLSKNEKKATSVLHADTSSGRRQVHAALVSTFFCANFPQSSQFGPKAPDIANCYT
jgi:hypothetical protein